MSLSPSKVFLICAAACIPLAITGAHAADALFATDVVTALVGVLVISLGAGLPAAYLLLSRRQRAR